MSTVSKYELTNGEKKEREDADVGLQPTISVVQQKTRRLVLHLDLNNTILVSDAASGQGPIAALNSYLSTVVWGKISSTGEWEWISDLPSVNPPCEDAVSYYSQFGRNGRLINTKMGKRFKKVFARHMNLLEWQGEADSLFSQSGEDGKLYHWILPSFFHLLGRLHQQGRQFCVVLRTFGTDLPRVLPSLHAAFAGKHPHFPHLQQVPLSVDLTVGRIRCSKRETVLTYGSDRVSTKGKERRLYDYFSSMSGIGGFQDHFDWWAQNSFTSSGGKPFWIDPNDCDNLHIIIDDNVWPHEQDSIVDCRVLLDKQKGKEWRKATASELYDVCVVRTDLLKAIAEKEYFADCVQACEENYGRYLQDCHLE